MLKDPLCWDESETRSRCLPHSGKNFLMHWELLNNGVIQVFPFLDEQMSLSSRIRTGGVSILSFSLSPR
jgi:hypothetical protein